MCASIVSVNAQAIPYCWMLFIVPMHLLTHELLLFATGIWTANIHDNIDGRRAAPGVLFIPMGSFMLPAPGVLLGAVMALRAEQ